jgi:hypothetical protein
MRIGMGKAAIGFGKFLAVALLSALPGAWLIGTMTDSVAGWILGALAALPFVAAGLLLAAPAMLALRRSGRNSALNYLLLGAGVGVLLEWMVEIAIASDPFSPLRLGGAWGAAIGLWSSAMWCLFFRDRPGSFARPPGDGGSAAAR